MLRIPSPVRWAAALLFVAFATGAGVIAIDGMNDRHTKADVVVVPGNTVNSDGSLSPRLKARLDAALTLFKSKQCSFILVSGGTGKEGVDEALAMGKYLVASGVPSDQVITDSAGSNTEATARNTALALRAHKLKTVIAASQFFHITRLRTLLEREGVLVAGNVHAQYFELRDVYSLAREVFAMAALALRRDAA
jgi:vancomycin permeability regulator SanA